MALSGETTAGVMRGMNLATNAWGAQEINEWSIGVWQEQLEAAGMTDENAAEFRTGFCRQWDTKERPSLNHFCSWIRNECARHGGHQPMTDAALRKAHTDPVAVETVQSMKRRLVEIKAAQRGALPF